MCMVCTTCYSNDIISTSYMCYTSGLPRDTMHSVQLTKKKGGRLVIKCEVGRTFYKLVVRVRNE